MILNVAFYQFADFGPEERRRELRVRLQARGLALDLRGTILLASEGINGFLAGREEDVRAMLAELRALPEFVGLATKDSWSAEKPFGRFKVKLKREIISMGRPHIRPHEKTGSRLLPVELKKWLDEGRDILLLDTRNTYEIEKGTFEKARHLNIQNFRQFGEALETIEPEARKKPVVMFCTGGIRCEKATALALQDAGFTDVHQLEGGILRYFEDCGNAHYNGGCFVFDERDTLSSDLRAQSTAVQILGIPFTSEPKNPRLFTASFVARLLDMWPPERGLLFYVEEKIAVSERHAHSCSDLSDSGSGR